MHPIRFTLGLLGLAGGALGAMTALAPTIVAAAPATEIRWRNDLEGARAEAKREGKPLLITFR